jgi:hypothetical protein
VRRCAFRRTPCCLPATVNPRSGPATIVLAFGAARACMPTRRRGTGALVSVRGSWWNAMPPRCQARGPRPNDARSWQTNPSLLLALLQPGLRARSDGAVQPPSGSVPQLARSHMNRPQPCSRGTTRASRRLNHEPVAAPVRGHEFRGCSGIFAATGGSDGVNAAVALAIGSIPEEQAGIGQTAAGATIITGTATPVRDGKQAGQKSR